MGVTQDQIYANLQALDFNNPAVLAIFGKVAEAVGIPIDNTLTEIDNNKTAILNIVNTKGYGKDDYYVTAAKAFQLGDDLAIDPVTKKNVYAVIDPSKQIIAQAAFEELGSDQEKQLFVKIAKKDPVTGLLVQLTNSEYAAFSSYFTTFQLPGLPVTVINKQANILSFAGTLTFFNTYNLTTLQTNFQNALNSFRDSFAFNGEFFNGDLTAYIKQQVPGDRDFFITNTTIDGVPFSGSISLPAGYFNYISNIFNQIQFVGV